MADEPFHLTWAQVICAACFLNLAQLFIFHRTNTKVCVDYTAAASEIYWDVVSAIIIYNS